MACPPQKGHAGGTRHGAFENIPADNPIRSTLTTYKNTPPCRRGRRCVKIIGEISNEVNITDTTGLQTAPTGGLPATGGTVSCPSITIEP